jgi:two-component system, cell cycle response regulator
MSRVFSVVLCGLTAKDARMVQIVLSRAPSMNLRNRFAQVELAQPNGADIALVDTQSPYGWSELEQVRSRNPAVLPITISDDGNAAGSRFRLARRSLLLELLRVVDAAAGSLSGMPQPVANAAAATPKVAPVAPQVARESVALVVGHEAPPAGSRDAKPEPLSALVVDDSAAVRSQLEAALKRIGIHATLADGAEQALTHSKHRQFDLVFLDVVMPGKDGYQVCREIKQNPYTRQTPVLMLTSRSSPFDRARGALAGCDTYLVKPIDLKSFYVAVDKVLMRTFKDDRSLLLTRGYRPLAA